MTGIPRWSCSRPRAAPILTSLWSRVCAAGLSQGDDQLRPDQFDLPLEIGQAGGRFLRRRRAVLRRPAFDRIGDIDIASTPQADGRQHVVEKFSRLADEGLAALVFLRARAFTDEKPVSVDITDTQYRLLARLAQGHICGTPRPQNANRPSS
jgi:hypothetical protein